MPPPRRRPGRPYVSSTVLLRIEFTAPDSLQPASELLPHFSTLAPLGRGKRKWLQPCMVFAFISSSAFAGRYLSVALFLKSPSAGVTRYPCPVEPGLSSRWAFRRSRAAARPGCRGILADFPRKVKSFSPSRQKSKKATKKPLYFCVGDVIMFTRIKSPGPFRTADNDKGRKKT